jgi:transporter family-2 protein
MDKDLSFFLIIGLMIVVGMMIALQGPLNAKLSQNIGSFVLGSAISFAVGLVALIILWFAGGTQGSLAVIKLQPLYLLSGGLLGVCFVWAFTWAVPQIGVFFVVISAIIGQMIGAVVIARIGMFGVAPNYLGLSQFVGLGFLTIGAVLIYR